MMVELTTREAIALLALLKTAPRRADVDIADLDALEEAEDLRHVVIKLLAAALGE